MSCDHLQSYNRVPNNHNNNNKHTTTTHTTHTVNNLGTMEAIPHWLSFFDNRGIEFSLDVGFYSAYVASDKVRVQHDGVRRKRRQTNPTRRWWIDLAPVRTLCDFGLQFGRANALCNAFIVSSSPV